MTPALALLIPQLLLRFLVASCVGAGSYLLWRSLEKKSPPLPLIGTVLLFLFGVSFSHKIISDDKNVLIFAFLLILIFPCVLGSSFHEKSGGESKTRFLSLILLFIATCSSLLFGSIFTYNLLKPPFSNFAEIMYFCGLLASPSMTPILIYIGDNMKLRPGKDKYLES